MYPIYKVYTNATFEIPGPDFSESIFPFNNDINSLYFPYLHTLCQLTHSRLSSCPPPRFGIWRRH